MVVEILLETCNFLKLFNPQLIQVLTFYPLSSKDFSDIYFNTVSSLLPEQREQCGAKVE